MTIFASLAEHGLASRRAVECDEWLRMTIAGTAAEAAAWQCSRDAAAARDTSIIILAIAALMAMLAIGMLLKLRTDID